MNTQTIFKAGNSDVVSLPKGVMDEVGFKRGSEVVVQSVPELGGVLIKNVKSKNIAKGEFETWLKKALSEDAGILDELEKR